MAPGPSRRTVAASYDLEMKAMKIDWEKILGADKPELQVQQYQALCPVAPNGDARWTAQNEQALQQEWQNDPKANHINHFDFNTKAVELKALWKIFPRMYRCLPTDLISPEYGLRFDETTNDNLPGSIQNPIWAPKFCAALKMFSLHVFWHYSREHDFHLMAIVLKYAFMSRTHDCRKWPSITNPIDSSFLDRFLAARNSPDMQDCTLLEVHDKVAAELQGKRPSDLSLIFRGIEKYIKKHGSSTVKKTVEPAPLIQLLRTKDVEAAVAGLEAVNSKGYLSAAHWAMMCTKTRESTQEPPQTTDLLSRVFASGYMGGLRWERILARPLPSSVPAAPDASVNDPFDLDQGVLAIEDIGQDVEAEAEAEAEGGFAPMHDMAANRGDSPEDIYSADDAPLLPAAALASVGDEVFSATAPADIMSAAGDASLPATAPASAEDIPANVIDSAGDEVVPATPLADIISAIGDASLPAPATAPASAEVVPAHANYSTGDKVVPETPLAEITSAIGDASLPATAPAPAEEGSTDDISSSAGDATAAATAPVKDVTIAATAETVMPSSIEQQQQPVLGSPIVFRGRAMSPILGESSGESIQESPNAAMLAVPLTVTPEAPSSSAAITPVVAETTRPALTQDNLDEIFSWEAANREEKWTNNKVLSEQFKRLTELKRSSSEDGYEVSEHARSKMKHQHM